MVRILHVLPGRLRLRFDALKGRPDLASRLHRGLEDVTLMRRVEIDTRTGSALLLFDPGALRSPKFLAELSDTLGSFFPDHFAPGLLSFTSKRLKGEPGLARRIVGYLSQVEGIERIEVDPSTGRCRLIYDPKVVTSPGFRASLGGPLELLLPKLDVRKLLSRVGL